MGEKRKALEFFDRALPTVQMISDRAGEAITLSSIGLVWHDLGANHKALGFYNRTLLVFQQVGDRVGEAMTLNNITEGINEVMLVPLQDFRKV